MKFIHESMSLDLIERRVREEECRTGKRVVEVKLNREEWVEFTMATNAPSAYSCPPTLPLREVRFTMRRRMPPLRCAAGECGCGLDARPVDTITVRPG